MKNLEYFRVGFNCGSVVSQLEKIRDKKEHNGLILKIGYDMIKECENVLNPNNSKLPENFGLYHKLFFPNWNLIVKSYSKEELTKILKEKINQVKQVKTTLETILKNKPISSENIKESIDFFDKLHNRCLSEESPTPYF